MSLTSISSPHSPFQSTRGAPHVSPVRERWGSNIPQNFRVPEGATHQEPLQHSQQIATVELIHRENVRWKSYRLIRIFSSLFPRQSMTGSRSRLMALLR